MSLVNIPDFIVADINVNETSAIKKIGLIIFGKVTSLVINTNQPKVICRFLNLFYKSTGKIKYENSFFTKNYGDNKKIFYPNLRFLRVARGVEFQFSKILDDYTVAWEAFESMKESASLIPGDFPLNFSNIVDSIPSINEVKEKSNLPVLILLDPEESFLTKLKRYNSENRKTANTLTYVKKYLGGQSLAKQMADIIATFYRVEYPAALVLQAGTENRSFSNLEDPEELYQIINNEDLIRENKPLKDETDEKEQDSN